MIENVDNYEKMITNIDTFRRENQQINRDEKIKLKDSVLKMTCLS